MIKTTITPIVPPMKLKTYYIFVAKELIITITNKIATVKINV